MLKKKICPSFQRIIKLFTQKFVTGALKNMVLDPGSEIQDPGSGKNLFRIPDLRIRNTDGRVCVKIDGSWKGQWMVWGTK
jgi:hypothetical protein